MFTRKDFLTGSVALAAATGVRGALGAANRALTTPDVTFKDLQTVNRDIPAGYYLRPIPQGQLDGMQMESEAKKNYQNPAYR